LGEAKELHRKLHDIKENCHGVLHDRIPLNPVGGPQLLLNFAGRCLRSVCSLNVLVYSDQRLLEGLEGAGVQHFLLDLRGVWAPRHQEQLLLLRALGCALRVQLIG